MMTVEAREAIRRAYFIDGKSIRTIAREQGHGRRVIREALQSAEPARYRLVQPRPAPVLGPYHARIDQLLAENAQAPRTQRYTSHKIYGLLRADGYPGSESRVRGYIAGHRRQHQRPAVFLPLEFDPGTDAQADWGEGAVIMAGEQVSVQVFGMRLCYSRRLFLMAFPAQRQEAFFAGHVHAFQHFHGVPQRISYDNLKTAVQRILTGHTRQEQQSFIAFRSHYLFDSHFCTPGQGHEKGGIEHGLGFGRRNFLVPLPEVASFDDLNAYLLAQCQADDARQVQGQPHTIGQAWEQERPHLRPLPIGDFPCCVTRPVALTPYSQVIFETNRYSVPVEQARPSLVLKAYPLWIEIFSPEQRIARHPRCYDRDQDLFDPLHYLPLLAQRPGAFEHAKPLRQWRHTWPPVYEQLLSRLRTQWPDGRGVREFIRILHLHRDYPVSLLEQAVTQALAYGCGHLDGVTLCCHQLLHPEVPMTALTLADQPRLQQVGLQPLDLAQYDHLLTTE